MGRQAEVQQTGGQTEAKPQCLLGDICDLHVYSVEYTGAVSKHLCCICRQNIVMTIFAR